MNSTSVMADQVPRNFSGATTIRVDPAEVLPAAAAADLEALRHSAKSAHAVLMSFTDQLEDQRRLKAEAERRRDELLKVHRLAENDPLVAAEIKKIARAAQKTASLQAAHDRTQAEWRELSGLVSALDRFAQSLPPGSVTAYAGPAPSLRKGESVAQAVERCRCRMRELLADKKKYETAGLPSARAHELIRAEVDRYAELGRPDLIPVLDYGDAIRWPTSVLNNFGNQRHNTAVGEVQSFDGLAVMIWLFKDHLIATFKRRSTRLPTTLPR